MANELGTLVSQFRNVKATNADYQLAFVQRQVNRVAHSLLRTPLLESTLVLTISSFMYHSFGY